MLVGGFSHLEKYEFVSGKDAIHIYIYDILWKIKAMFETTIQNMTWAGPMAPWPHNYKPSWWNLFGELLVRGPPRTTNGEATMGMGVPPS